MNERVMFLRERLREPEWARGGQPIHAVDAMWTRALTRTSAMTYIIMTTIYSYSLSAPFKRPFHIEDNIVMIASAYDNKLLE